MISNAFAADQVPAGGLSQFVVLGLFMALFYALLWRPQAKRAKAHRDLVDSLSAGDEVVTNGGLAGTIESVSQSFIHLKVAETTSLLVQRQAIAHVLPKGTIESA